MTKKNPGQPDNNELELTEDALEQVSGGFNPQPDPPGRADKWNQQISQGLLLPAVKVAVQKI
ncbi:MAG: hypothetical protein J0I20_17910 [Chloroflexi bacterium]|nr:hypothetical protein [Chloroflexota bacterium]